MESKKIIAIIGGFLIIGGCLLTSGCSTFKTSGGVASTEESTNKDSGSTEDTVVSETEETELVITEDMLTTTKTVDKLPDAISMRTLTLAGLTTGWCTLNYTAEGDEATSKLYVAQKDAGDDNSFMYIYMCEASEDELQSARDEMLSEDALPVQREVEEGSYVGIDYDGYFTNIQYATSSMSTLYATVDKQDEAQDAMQLLHSSILSIDDLYESVDEDLSISDLEDFTTLFEENGYIIENIGEEDEEDPCINAYYTATNADADEQFVYYEFADSDTLWSTLSNFAVWVTNDSFESKYMTLYNNGCKFNIDTDEYSAYAVLTEDNNRLFFVISEVEDTSKALELAGIIAK